MQIKKTAVIACIITSIVINVIPLFAEEIAKSSPDTKVITPPWDRFYWASLTVAKVNPLGFETQNRFMYSRRLVDSSSMLFRDTFLAIGPSFKLSPAGLKSGPLLDFQPIAILNLRLGYEYVNYFGTSGYLRSYAVSDADYSDDTREDTKDEAYSTTGHRYFSEITPQMKIKNIALRSKFTFEYWNLNLKDGDNYSYDPTLDALIENKKEVWSNDTDLLYLSGPMTLGIRYSGVYQGDGRNHMRVGPLLAWSFNSDEYTGFNKPTLICILGWYIDHKYREGKMPYILAGFSFSVDFLKP